MDLLTTALALGVIYFLFSNLVSILNEVRSGLIESRQKMLKAGIYDALNDVKNTAFGHLVYTHPLLDYYRKTPDDSLNYIPSDTFAKSLISSIQRYASLVVDPKGRTNTAVPGEPDENNLASVTNAEEYLQLIKKLNPSDKRILLESFALNAKEIGEVEKNIINWFNGLMVQKTQWYKSKQRMPMFIIALIAAIILNVDSFHIARYLSKHSAQATAIAGNADVLLKNYAKVAPTSESKDSLKLSLQNVMEAKKQWDEMNLPVGWDFSVKSTKTNFQEHVLAYAGEKADNTNLFYLILGWIFTAFLGSFGAPFWFDLLNNFVNIKRSGNLITKKS